MLAVDFIYVKCYKFLQKLLTYNSRSRFKNIYICWIYWVVQYIRKRLEADGQSDHTIVDDDMHFIWAQGRTVVIKSIDTEQNTYLKGHEGRICQIAISKTGALLATGEQMGPETVSAVIVWDFDQRDMLYRVRYHNEAI